MGAFNVSEVDTTPGANDNCPFTPPDGWEGGELEYLELMRRRYRCVGHYQKMVVTANFAKRNSVQVTGPFSTEAMDIISVLKSNQK